MFFKGKHEAARMELRFINKTGNKHFDKPSYINLYTYNNDMFLLLVFSIIMSYHIISYYFILYYSTV